MAPLHQLDEPTSAHCLIAFTDLRSFMRASRQLESSANVFAFLDSLAHTMSRIVGKTSGRILKFMGDSAMILYPGEDTDQGVRNLLELKSAADAETGAKGIDTRMTVSAHYGEVTIGPFGPEHRLDAYGESVNRAATAGAGDRRADFVITPEAFRRLDPGTRKAFRKYTPPIVYVAT